MWSTHVACLQLGNTIEVRLLESRGLFIFHEKALCVADWCTWTPGFGLFLAFYQSCNRGIHTGMVQWLPLLPHGKKVPGSNLLAGDFLCGDCRFSLWLHGLSLGNLAFFHLRKACMFTCWFQIMTMNYSVFVLWWTGYNYLVYLLSLVTAGIVSSLTPMGQEEKEIKE